MSHRNTPIDPVDFTLIIDGMKTNIPAYDAETIATLKWDRHFQKHIFGKKWSLEYYNNRNGQFSVEPELNVEYF